MAEIQRKTIRVGNSGSGYARNVPIILDAVIVKQDIENNKTLVRATLRKEQVYDSNLAYSLNCYSTTQGVYQNIGKMYFDTGTIQTTEFWVNHKNDGTGSSYVSASLYTNYGSVSLSGTFNLTTIPRASTLEEITSFNVEDTIPLTINKHIDNWQDDLNVYINDTIITTKENVISGDNIVFSEEELNLIYDIMKETNNIDFKFVLSTYSVSETDKTFIGSSIKNAVGSIKNANPIFTNFDFIDNNELTVSLTNNNKSFIKGYSSAVISIPIKDKAIGQKGAYIKSYKAIIGDIQRDAIEIEEDITFKAINNVSSNQIIVYAIDSRGNESEKIIKYPDEYIIYNEITVLNLEVNRDGGIGENTTLEFSGNFYNDTFGSTGVQNEIKGFYLYNENGSSSNTRYIELELDVKDNKYSFKNKIQGDLNSLGFNAENEYVITIKIADLLNTNGKFENELLLSGKPNMALADTGVVAFGGVAEEDSKFQAQFKDKANFENGIYIKGTPWFPVGYIYISVNPTSPAELFGGSWRRIKDTFLLASGDTYEAGTTGGSATVTLELDQIPKHSHSVKGTVGAGGYAEGVAFGNSSNPGYTSNVGMASVGNNQPHENMPPYLTVYMWEKIEDIVSVSGETLICENTDENNKDIEVIDETLIIYKEDIVDYKEGVMSFE